MQHCNLIEIVLVGSIFERMIEGVGATEQWLEDN